MPDGIEFTNKSFPWTMGLIFNDSQQELGYQHKKETWGVTVGPKALKTPLYLTPCKREDLKPGDWVFVADSVNTNFMSKCGYRLRLENDKFALVDHNQDIKIFGTKFDHYWKVTE